MKLSYMSPGEIMPGPLVGNVPGEPYGDMIGLPGARVALRLAGGSHKVGA